MESENDFAVDLEKNDSENPNIETKEKSFDDVNEIIELHDTSRDGETAGFINVDDSKEDDNQAEEEKTETEIIDDETLKHDNVIKDDGADIQEGGDVVIEEEVSHEVFVDEDELIEEKNVDKATIPKENEVVIEEEESHNVLLVEDGLVEERRGDEAVIREENDALVTEDGIMEEKIDDGLINKEGNEDVMEEEVSHNVLVDEAKFIDEKIDDDAAIKEGSEMIIEEEVSHGIPEVEDKFIDGKVNDSVKDEVIDKNKVEMEETADVMYDKENTIEIPEYKSDNEDNVGEVHTMEETIENLDNVYEADNLLRDNTNERENTDISEIVMDSSEHKDVHDNSDDIARTEQEIQNLNTEKSYLNEENQSLKNSQMFFTKTSNVKDVNANKIDTIEFDHLPQSCQNRQPVSALTPVFSFGFNHHVPIINLSNEKRSFIFYGASHLAIVYDYVHNEQMILQGHCNTITCTTASKDKRWLGTGDKGDNSVVILWDCNTGLPVRTMFEPHPNGVVGICLTPDARYLATLSAEKVQTFAIWDWTTGDDIPLCSSSLLESYGIQRFISFNEDDILHVATNGDSQVLFHQWDKVGNLKYFAPKLTDKDFNKQIGKFSNTVFLPKTTKAITATSQGLLVVWEGNVPLVKVSNEPTSDKKAVKLVPVHQKGINVLTLIDSYIVTGDAAGEIKFFDFNFMLIFWYKDWNFGAITSISPANNRTIDGFKPPAENSEYPDDATIEKNKFRLRDFIVGTSSTIFATVRVEGSKIQIIFREHDQSVFSVAAHPTLPLVATGSYSGLLKIWDYEQRRSLKTRFFDKVAIKCLCFDHHGSQLAVGFTNGEVRILDTHALQDVTKTPFHFSKVQITKIVFSEKSEYLATVDANCTTTLYRAGRSQKEESWVYLARYRAHYKAVVDIMFGRFFETEIPRLFTLGEDRRLVEYDLSNTSEDNLVISQDLRIEQRSIPLAMCWYPEENGEGFLFTANDEYKLKMYNHQTKMCRYSLLGPTFGSPVKILTTLPINSDHPQLEDGTHQRYVTYANQNKIGIMRLPFNGNPYNYMTTIAHPKGVTNMCSSFDGKYLISVGEDFIVSIWSVNVDILETQSRIGGSDMSPYYELIEGGEFGMFMHELKDYFYYSMIRTQGIDSLQTRTVDIVIDITEVPYIMRGIGFYPSEEEIENMLNELKFRDYYLTGECCTTVDLDTFLKLYINHRPAFGIPSSKIEEAFTNILKGHGGELSIDTFLDLLINNGENILEDDLAEYLATLLGFNPTGGTLEMENFEPHKIINAVNDSLPKFVTPQNFIEDILCMKILDKDTPLSNKVTSTSNAASGTQT